MACEFFFLLRKDSQTEVDYNAHMRQMAALRKLPSLIRKVRKLSDRVVELEAERARTRKPKKKKKKR